MAATEITTGLSQVVGVKYTYKTDVASDWVNVPNSTYFYDLETNLPYYKNETGTVINVFGGGNTIYTANDTIGTGRVATLTDTLTFKDGTVNIQGNGTSTGSALSIYNNNTTPVKLWDFLDNGTLQKGDTIINIGNSNSTTGSVTTYAIGWNNSITGGTYGKLAIGDSNSVNGNNAYTFGRYNVISANNIFQFGNYLQSGAQGAFVIGHGDYSNSANKLVNNTASSLALGWNTTTPQHLFKSDGVVLNGSTQVSTEDISLQGSTLIKGNGTSTGSALAIYDNDTTPVKLWDFLDNGNVNLGVDSVVGIGANDLTFEGSGIFKLSNGAKSIYSTWATHTTLVLDNGNGATYRFYSANASTTFNAGEFAIGGSGSNIPFRIFNTSSVALGSVGKGSLDTNYNVQTAGATLIGGNLDTKLGTNEISLDHTNYPKLKISNGTNEYWLIEGDGTGSTFDTGDLYLYDQTNSQKILQFKQSNDSLLFSVNLDMNNNRITNTIVNPSVQETTSTATFTINVDEETDGVLTAMASATTIASPTGTPVQGQNLIFRFKDDGTARALTWNAIFRAIGITLPTTTTANKLLYIGCKYNSTDTKWDVVSVQEEA